MKKIEISRNGEKSTINRNEGVDEAVNTFLFEPKRIFNTITNTLLHQRKSVDPKERIRKEQDICLSPQRKSFNTGCYVANSKIENAANNNSNNNSNPNNNKGNPEK